MRRLALALLVLLAAPEGARAAGDPVADAAAEVQKAERTRGEADARLSLVERKNQDDAREIDRLKAELPSVARDYRLGRLLAAVQDRSGELDRLQAARRGLDQSLGERRRDLIAACDRALDDPKLPEVRRVEVLRRREVESERLSAGAQALWAATPAVDPLPLDGPAELSDKADLLKDREERLSREVDRLGRRIDGIESRRRLRERASAVDEDVFMESGTGRQVVRVVPVAPARDQKATGQFGDTNAAPQAGAGPTGGPGGNVPSGALSETADRLGASLRTVVDPATLDELRRAEAGSDLDAQLRTLKRMQSGLRSLADDLARREASLRKRAREIKPRK